MKLKLVNWGVLIIGIVILVRLAGNTWKLFRSGDRVSQAEKQLAEVKKANTDLQNQLKEVQTPQYLEREAREKLGYGKPGEVVMIIPEEDLAHPNLSKPKSSDPNWVQWRKLYLGF